MLLCLIWYFLWYLMDVCTATTAGEYLTIKMLTGFGKVIEFEVIFPVVPDGHVHDGIEFNVVVSCSAWWLLSLFILVRQ